MISILSIARFHSFRADQMRFVGVDDCFGQSGTPEELIEHYGMGRDAIVNAARDVMVR